MSVATAAAPLASSLPFGWTARPSRPRLQSKERPRPVRLTRRGRLVRAVAALVGVLCVVAWLVPAASSEGPAALPGAALESHAGAPAGVSAATTVATGSLSAVTVSGAALPEATRGAESGAAVSGSRSGDIVVRSGESLWLVARRVAPERDPREVVWELREANGLVNPVVHPGQSLRAPGGAR